MSYSNHTDEELLRHANIEFNALTSTHLERVLVDRFEAALEEKAIGDAAVEVLNNFNLDMETTKDVEQLRDALQFAQDYDLKTARALLDLAGGYDIDCADALKPMLEIADQVCQMRDDVSEGFATLNKIFNPTLTTN